MNCRFLLRVFDFKFSSRSPFFIISCQPDAKRAFRGKLTKFFDVVPDKNFIET